MNTKPLDFQNMPTAFWALIDANTQKEAMNLLHQYPDLLSDQVDNQLGLMIKDAFASGQAEMAKRLGDKRILLRSVRQSLNVTNGTDQLDEQVRIHETNFLSDFNQAKAAEQDYLQTDKLRALEDAITAWERILNHPNFTQHVVGKEFLLTVLNDSAGTYLRRYFAKGVVADLERALSQWQQAVSLTPAHSPDLPILLNGLGSGFFRRYECTNKLNDLEQAIAACQRAVTLSPANSPVLPSILSNLGNSLYTRHARNGVESDLQAGIAAYQRAVQLTPAGSPDLHMFLNNLGGALRTRYASTGALSDLEEAIKNSQQAVKLTPVNSPYLPSHLSNLGNSFQDRYVRTGAINDLDKAIEAKEKAVALTPAKSTDRPGCLNNLGVSLKDRYTRDRYTRQNAVDDLKSAITYFRQAVKLILVNSPDFPMYLSSLGNSLRSNYIHTELEEHLEEAIQCCQQAVKLTPANSPALPGRLFSLAVCLKNRYTRKKLANDLEEAIQRCQEAVKLTSANSPDLSLYLNTLGNGFQDRYARTGDESDLKAAIANYQQAAQRGAESEVALEEGLRSARNWLHWAFARQAWEEVTQAYFYAYQAGQRLLQAQLLRTHKESWLKDMQGLASQAAYAFTKLKQPKEAVVALERGIAILLSEALQRDRANLEQLKTTGRNDLYDRYQDLVGRYHWVQQQQNVEALKTTQADLDKTIEDIRQVPGYENFFKPVEFDLIQKAAQETPLVYILTTSAGGLALIVHQQTTPTPVELPEFTDEALTQKRISYFTAYDNQQQNRQAWHQAIDDMGQWLWQILWQPLREKLPNQQRITLIPVGWLNLLPLHAVWTADPSQPTGRRYALDEVTIAYAPNAVSLQKACDLATHIPSDKLLAIDEPKPVKLNPLPSSSVEVNAIIARYFTQTQLLAIAQLLRHEAATQETVKNALKLNYNVLHFSCHGGANLANPLETGLVMANDQMLTVRHFLDAKLQARLATLSACETGMIGTKNLEEVVGLPASLLQAGVAGVVASLWSVSDLSTALLMIKFYECFFQNPSDTAVALRTAQCWLRDATQQELLDWAKSTLSGDNLKEVEETLDGYNPDEKPYEKPYYWAAFCAVGQ